MKRNTKLAARTLDLAQLTVVRGGYDLTIKYDISGYATLQNLSKPIDPTASSAVDNTK